MSLVYAVSVYTKLNMDLPPEWVTAFTALREAGESATVEFPDLPEDLAGEGTGREIAGLIRSPRYETKPTYDFGKCVDHLKGGVEHCTYHLSFWNLVLDDLFYHPGYAFLMFLARYNEGNRFVGTICETYSSVPDLIYFLEGQLEIVKLKDGGSELGKIPDSVSF